jgi:hypothetical protein
MQEKVRNAMATELAVGGALFMLGVAALAGELNTAIADVVLRLWPLGLVGLGVALVVRRP